MFVENRANKIILILKKHGLKKNINFTIKSNFKENFTLVEMKDLNFQS